MKILITGSNGLLGQHLVTTLAASGRYQVVAAARGENRLPITAAAYAYVSLDITDGIAVNECIAAHRPDVIIHAAAMTQPDPCEEQQVQCWNINVTATRFLIDAAKAVNASFIYISTDFVFDGLHGPYKETDLPGPVNYYGSSKLAAERAVMESTLQWAIVRTVLVYGNILAGTRSNIISWVKENLENNKPIKVVSDQLRTPTYVEDLVKGIVLIVEKKATGIYHIAGAEEMSPYNMAMATASHLQLNKSLITEVNDESFTQPAKRPLRTGFVIDKAKNELGYQPVLFKDALEKMLE